MRFLATLLFVYLLFISGINSVFAAETQIASGTYWATSDDFSERPLFLTSENDDLAWSFVQNSQVELPSSLKSVFLMSTSSCTETFCLTVGWGGNRNDEYDTTNFILLSRDQGHSWFHVKNLADVIKTPSKYYTFHANSCVNNACVVVGDIYPNIDYSATQPFILSTLDQGQSWRVGKIINNPYKDAQAGAVSCTTQFCGITAMSLEVTDKGLFSTPFLLTSMDAGQSWSVAHIDGIPDRQPGLFSAIRCLPEGCVVAANLVQDTQTKPRLISGGGNSNKPWKLIDTGLPPSTKGLFTNLNCSQNDCIAVGSYEHDKHTNPLILVSHDGAKHWLASKSIFNYPNVPDVYLDSVSCNNNICIILGATFPKGKKYKDDDPLILVSTDKGDTWSYINIAWQKTRPRFVMLTASHCAGKICTIVGGQSDIDTPTYYNQPLLLLSTDGAQSWKDINPDAIANMPKSFHSGLLAGITHA